MGTDRYITWGETPEWGAPTPEKLAAVALDFLGPRWTSKLLRGGDAVVLESDDYCTFHLASEQTEMGDPFKAHGGTRPKRGFVIYFDEHEPSRIRVNTRTHDCDSFTSTLADRYTTIIAKWWNGKVEWPSDPLYKLREACEAYMKCVEDEDFNEDRLANYENPIFEAAMEHIFDKKIWDKVNARLSE